MQDVNYINSRGLRVILKVHGAMKLRGGRAVLINLQPHIKEVFDIINALPAQRIFANRHELDSYLNAMQSRCFGAGLAIRLSQFASQPPSTVRVTP